jgi:hypothetical protein
MKSSIIVVNVAIIIINIGIFTMPETRFFINEIVIFENNRTNIVAILSPKAFTTLLETAINGHNPKKRISP